MDLIPMRGRCWGDREKEVGGEPGRPQGVSDWAVAASALHRVCGLIPTRGVTGAGGRPWASLELQPHPVPDTQRWVVKKCLWVG